MDGSTPIDATIRRQHDQKPTVRDIEMTSKFEGDAWIYRAGFDGDSVHVQQFGDEGPATGSMTLAFSDLDQLFVEYQKFKALQARVRAGE